MEYESNHHVSLFHILAIVKIVTMKMEEQISLQITLLFSFGSTPIFVLTRDPCFIL